jgi:hypothetical protein
MKHDYETADFYCAFQALVSNVGIEPFKCEMFAAARQLFNLNAHCKTIFCLSD